MAKQNAPLGKIIVFVNQKGGVGKSTLTINIAAMLSRHLRVMLLDTDAQGSSSDWGNARKQKLESANKVRCFSNYYKNVERASVVTADLQDAAANYDVLMVDTPGRNEVVSLGVIAAANLVVIPLTPGNFAFWSSEVTRLLIQKIAVARPTDFAARLLLNMRDDRRKISAEAEKLLSELEIPVMKTSIGNRSIFEASSEGLSIMEIPAKSESDRKGQREMAALVDEIQEILAIKTNEFIKDETKGAAQSRKSAAV